MMFVFDILAVKMSLVGFTIAFWISDAVATNELRQAEIRRQVCEHLEYKLALDAKRNEKRVMIEQAKRTPNHNKTDDILKGNQDIQALQKKIDYIENSLSWTGRK